MVDVFSPEKRSAVMSAIRSKDTSPELAIRRGLFRLGYRFRLHRRDLPGKPDVVLPQHRVVVQVRGCFWHLHDCSEGRIPGSRREYWEPKLLANRVRDSRNDRALRALGWKVIVVWECRCSTRAGLLRETRRLDREIKKRVVVKGLGNVDSGDET